MKKILSLFFALWIIVLFSSCSKMEIDKTAIISSVYIYSSGQELEFNFNTVENEGASILDSYTVTAESLAEAKKILEDSAVNYLFFGQLECAVLSEKLTYEQINNSLGYFSGGYECSPGVTVLFAEERALQSLLSGETSEDRLLELAELVKSQNPDTALTVYSLYNSLEKNSPHGVNGAVLYFDGQLQGKSVPFSSLNSGKSDFNFEKNDKN